MRCVIILTCLLAGCTARADYMRLPGYDDAHRRCAADAAPIEDTVRRFYALGDCLDREGFAPVVHFYMAGFRIEPGPLSDPGRAVDAQSVSASGSSAGRQ